MGSMGIGNHRHWMIFRQGNIDVCMSMTQLNAETQTFRYYIFIFRLVLVPSAMLKNTEI